MMKLGEQNVLLLNEEQKEEGVLILIDILVGMVVEEVCMGGEWGVESGNTINRLSSSLSCLSLDSTL